MSWLSKELNRSKLGKVVNKVAKVPLSIGRSVIDKIPVIGTIADAAELAGNYIPEIGKGGSQAVANAALPQLGTLGSSIGSVLGGNSGLNALALAQGLNAAALGKKSNEYATNAMKTQDDLWKQRAGLRAGGIEGMNRTPVDLPQLGTLGAVGNPFAKRAI